MSHVLVTGPIEGRIPHGDGFLNVTPHLLEFDTAEEAEAAAASIEMELTARGTHPVQAECTVLNEHRSEFGDDVIAAHQVAHEALNEKVGL